MLTVNSLNPKEIAMLIHKDGTLTEEGKGALTAAAAAVRAFRSCPNRQEEAKERLRRKAQELALTCIEGEALTLAEARARRWL